MTFTKRRLSAKFELGTGNFGLAGVNSVTFNDHRMRADITYSGGSQMADLTLQISGMPLDIMQRLTVLNKLGLTYARKNIVTVSAGDDENGLSVAFVGTITEAWADFQDAPNGKFVVTAFTGQDQAMRPVPPTSYAGSIDVATVIAGIGAQWNPRLTLENSGVNTRIDSPYLSGSLLEQLRTIAKAANINCIVGPGNVIAIWPKGKARDGEIATISADTGMIGYPVFTQNGVRFRTLYNPSLTFGRRVRIKSLLGAASGVWRVDSVSHNLESETVGGAWETSVECGLLGSAVPIT